MMISGIVSNILTLYSSGQGDYHTDIEAFIQSILKDDPHRITILEQLCSLFNVELEFGSIHDEVVVHEDERSKAEEKHSAGPDCTVEQLSSAPNRCARGSEDLFKLLLGRDVSGSGLSEQEMMNRMAECLDAIFSQLNEILSAINSPLADTGDVTIRYVIKEHLMEGSDLNVVKEQIHQIKKAYLLTQESFQLASRSLVEKLLAELNPDSMCDEQGSSFKPGFLKKADGFKMFQVKHDRCLKWLESKRFNNDLLNEFEKEYFKKLNK